MKIQKTPGLIVGAAISGLLLGGCTAPAPTSGVDPSANLRAEFEQRIKQKDSEIDSLKSSLSEAQSTTMGSDDTSYDASASGDGLLPPNAKPGECYARVYIPPKYETTTEQVLKTAASQRVETVPAQFTSGEETVLTKEASQRLEIVPATYEYVTEQIEVTPASKKIVAVPAQYRTETEQVLVKDEHTLWKKGSGPITKIDASTGEIMCLVTIPAQYKTITKTVLAAEATTQEIEIPAEYKTVKKKVVKTPATTRTVEIPAEYGTVNVRKLAAPASSNVVEIPAEYQTVTRNKQVSDGYLEWSSILCETNASPTVISDLQRALTREGVYSGPIDGILGGRTARAVQTYQQKNSLPTGGITMDTLKSLKVAI